MSLLDQLPQLSDEADLKGQRVLLRSDFNVTLGNDGVVDDHEAYRIHRALPTLKYLQEQGARTIIASHFGRSGQSLKPVADYLNTHIDVGFVPEILSDRVTHMVNEMPEGTSILLENIRTDSREELNDPLFAQQLAKYADVFVNDAFSVSHRNHASVVGVPALLPSLIGLQFAEEVRNLERILEPAKPFVMILGGAKFAIKLDLLRKFLPKTDAVFIGGALANTFLKAQGHPVGESLVDESVDISDLIDHPAITLPNTIVVESGDQKITKVCDAVGEAESVMDVAPESIDTFSSVLSEAKTILWNGPMGNYENGFTEGTEHFAQLLSEQDAVKIVGGGDTVASIGHLGLNDKFDFVSAAGGAMLDFLVDGTLPGIDAIREG